jgi:hypothetical protein
MSYVQLQMVEVNVEDLLLDLDNYRIPTRPDDEAAALNYLFAEEDVLGAAKLILRDGYFDNEVPIVVEDGDAYVVLEGNRRVSALKGLLSPEAIPSHAHDLRALLKRYAVEADDLPEAIRALVAPSREAANPHIARLHTTVPKKRWSRDQQANYYYSLLGPTTTVDDLRTVYPDVDVVRFIKMVGMRRFLTGVAFSDPSLHDYVTGPDLTMSVFEYAYRNSDIAAAIGAAFDSDGHLQPTTLRPKAIGAALTTQQRAAVEYLMVEFRARRLNTRSAEFKKGSPAHLVLIDKLTGDVPSGDGEPSNDPGFGDGSPGDPTDGAGEGTESSRGTSGGIGGTGAGSTPGTPGAGDAGESDAQGGGPRGPNHPDTKATLSLSGLDYTTHTSQNLQRRYHELRKVNLKETPVAAALLLRSVLETTIKFHFDGTDTPASGQLSETFKVVVTAYGREKALKHSIGRIQSGGTSVPGSAQWFNLASHSVDLIVGTQQVREAFALIEPVLRRLLRPPDDPSA